MKSPVDFIYKHFSSWNPHPFISLSSLWVEPWSERCTCTCMGDHLLSAEQNNITFHFVNLLHFSKTRKLWSSKAKWQYSKGHGNFEICDWWISICFVCFHVSRFVACECNYDWWQWEMQLGRVLLNFKVRMFVKSTVMSKKNVWLTFYTLHRRKT